MLKKILKFDWILIFATLLLAGISLLVLYSLSTGNKELATNVFLKQSIFVALGICVMFFLALTDYHYLESYSRYIYFGTLLVLIIVLFFGTTVRGTVGWIKIGILNLQPVEIAKISLIIFIARFISKKNREIGEAGRLIVSLIISGVMIFLVIKQPDFGGAMVLAISWIGMILISSVSKKFLFLISLAIISFFAIEWSFLADYQKERIINFVHPELNARGSGYNVAQSLVAVGSGGLTGKGIGNGSQSQLNFLPEKHTDFIFAVITEELGFFGAAMVLFLYALIFYRIKKIADYAPDNFGFLVAGGIMILFFTQIAVNVGMNIGVIPVTGITLPFLSYGGSSLMAFFAAIGILLSINEKKNNLESKSLQSY
jgi:rod shape determining protein RodA